MCAEQPRTRVEAGKGMNVEKCRNTWMDTQFPFYRLLICIVCFTDILRFGSTALFDVGVDVDPSDNNNIVGVIRTPQPHSHLTAPSLLSPPSQPAQHKVCPGKIKLFYHSAPTLSLSIIVSLRGGDGGVEEVGHWPAMALSPAAALSTRKFRSLATS